MQGARHYIATQPSYESRYYAGGYPDDGYGVCTDVVAFAMREAGYDLQILVSQDIQAYPERYAIEVPDANIDSVSYTHLDVYKSQTLTYVHFHHKKDG